MRLGTGTLIKQNQTKTIPVYKKDRKLNEIKHKYNKIIEYNKTEQNYTKYNH